MKKTSKCETCVYCIYDDEYDVYECAVNLDQDEMERFIKRTYDDCPHYKLYDEYKTVRKQN